tara:strand:+ start:1508 stop:2089 length:582 start_codon:yes stop_codon:yes gene_type:complete
MTQFNSLEEGLTDLMERMEVDMPQFNDKVDAVFYNRSYACERLINMARESTTEHTVWINMVGNPFETTNNGNNFDNILWFLSYEQLAEHFDVPMSWVHAIRLKVKTDPMRRTWEAVGLNMTHEGYITDNCYAAFLDGVTAGLIPPADNIEELRHPDMVALTKGYIESFKEFMAEMDMNSNAEDILKGYDFTLA